jgi:hypothetical protein
MAVGTVGDRNNFKLPAMERMERIGYLDNDHSTVGAVWVVEGGINIGYCSTRFRMRS